MSIPLKKENLELINAVISGDYEKVRELLDIPGIDPTIGKSINEESPLVEAVLSTSRETVAVLLTNDKVKQQINDMWKHKYSGRNRSGTALTSAVNSCGKNLIHRPEIVANCFNIIKQLLAVPGININIKEDNGNTALLSAIYWDDIDTVKILLYPELFGLPNFNPPIDINAVNIFGQTPLISAVTPEKSKSLLIVDELLKQPNIVLDHKNVEGDSALMIAVKSLNVESVNLIVNKLKNSMNIKGAIEMIQEIQEAMPRVGFTTGFWRLGERNTILKILKDALNYLKYPPSLSSLNYLPVNSYKKKTYDDQLTGPKYWNGVLGGKKTKRRSRKINKRSRRGKTSKK